MTRHPDWQRRLDAVIQAATERPFSWGRHDCITFAAECVEAVTGVDLLQPVRGTWHSQLQALRMLSKLGGIPAVLTRHLGAEVPPLMARPGDVGITESGATVVCCGDLWRGPGACGLEFVHPFEIKQAWRCEGAACLK